MKLVSLNTWMGIVRDPLLDFVRSKKDSDIFCFQEILNGGAEEGTKMWANSKEVREHNLFSLLQKLLPDHVSFFYPHIGDWTGLAMFVHKDTEVLEEGEFFVHRSRTDTTGKYTPRNLQFVKIMLGGRPLTVINFHGLWSGGGKGDNEERIDQSSKIVEFIQGLGSDCVICGDFNLEPETQSLRMIENMGLRNLIKENNISSTRTSFYTKPQKFADYTFVSYGVRVKKFEVLPVEVSDHSPMFLEFD
ncbi:MAG: endonuclease/exonuclease/phosphatase family protein [Patescibacteria group bacterium]|nr:endonuclease/exonuclease/phosphatase family protein [Patescibacteria group bacterium]